MRSPTKELVTAVSFTEYQAYLHHTSRGHVMHASDITLSSCGPSMVYIVIPYRLQCRARKWDRHAWRLEWKVCKVVAGGMYMMCGGSTCN